MLRCFGAAMIGIETPEQAVDHRDLLQRLAKCSDRIGLRHH
jgi:hypothetical protein